MWKHIETYIQQNRASLDVEEPRPEIWAGIEARLGPPLAPPARPKPLFQVWKVAAAILIGTVAGLGLLHFGPQDTPGTIGAAGLQEVTQPLSAETWAEIQQTHQQDIAVLAAAFAELPALPDEAAAAFAHEQAELTEAIALLEARISRQGPQKALVDQWVRTQEAQAELLRRYLPDPPLE